MIQTTPVRIKELEAIEKIKAKLSHIKEIPVRINYKTVIFVREGKDINLAVEEFHRKQLEATKREFKNELQY